MEINLLWTLFLWWFWTRALTYVVVMTVPYCYSSCICSLKVSHCRQRHQNSIFRTLYTLKINGSIGIFTAVTKYGHFYGAFLCLSVCVGEFPRLVVRDPEPEQRTEDFSIEGAGEGEWHECPREDEWVRARLSHGNELDAFLDFVVVSYSVTFCKGSQEWGLGVNRRLY